MVTLVVPVAMALVVAACGADDEDTSASEVELSAAAVEGRRIAGGSGCAGCHGRDGEGGIGPTWVGLYESTVELDDGTTVVADDAYLVQAIAEPDAERVDGFPVAMSPNDLSDQEIASVVTYIKALGAEAGAE